MSRHGEIYAESLDAWLDFEAIACHGCPRCDGCAGGFGAPCSLDHVPCGCDPRKTEEHDA